LSRTFLSTCQKTDVHHRGTECTESAESKKTKNLSQSSQRA